MSAEILRTRKRSARARMDPPCKSVHESDRLLLPPLERVRHRLGEPTHSVALEVERDKGQGAEGVAVSTGKTLGANMTQHTVTPHATILHATTT